LFPSLPIKQSFVGIQTRQEQQNILLSSGLASVLERHQFSYLTAKYMAKSDRTEQEGIRVINNLREGKRSSKPFHTISKRNRAPTTRIFRSIPNRIDHSLSLLFSGKLPSTTS